MTGQRKSGASSGEDVDHPDRHKIEDWFLNGPKNGRVEELVRELTLGHGLRLQDVEELMVNVLLDQKSRLEISDGTSCPQPSTLQLAANVPAQFRMLQKAYGNGAVAGIDAAVNEVVEARRMKSNGVADMIASISDDDPT